jgi:hypothetical protein
VVRDAGVMGLNPHRMYSRHPFADAAFAVCGIAAALALVLWAFLG